MFKHYVYVYLDPRKNYNKNHLGINLKFEPFYIGKGQEERCFDHLIINDKDKNNLKKGKILQIINEGLIPLIEKIKMFETDKEAKDFEIKLIADIGTIAIIPEVNLRGPLCNLTKGGDGGRGWKYVMEKSIGYNERLSKRVKEYMNRPEVKKHLSEMKLGDKNPSFGKTKTIKEKQNLSKKVSESKQDLITITNGKNNRFVKLEMAQELFKSGWVLGYTKGDKEKNLSKQVKGRIHITNGKQNKFLKSSEAIEMLKNGWKKGRTIKKYKRKEQL